MNMCTSVLIRHLIIKAVHIVWKSQCRLCITINWYYPLQIYSHACSLFCLISKCRFQFIHTMWMPRFIHHLDSPPHPNLFEPVYKVMWDFFIYSRRLELCGRISCVAGYCCDADFLDVLYLTISWCIVVKKLLDVLFLLLTVCLINKICLPCRCLWLLPMLLVCICK